METSPDRGKFVLNTLKGRTVLLPAMKLGYANGLHLVILLACDQWQR